MDLFQKNIFSEKNAVFSKISNDDKKKLIVTINLFYPNCIIREIYAVGAFEINSNNWKVETAEGLFIFKRSDINKLNALTAQAEISHELAKQKFPTIDFVKNKDGNLISADEKSAYCLTHFKDGNYFGSSAKEWESLIIHLRSLSDQLAAHKNFHTFQLPVRDFFTKEENDLVEKLTSLSGLKQISEKELASVIKEYKESEITFREINIPANTGIFHVDIHPHNLIFENNKLVLLTDFEGFQVTNIKVSLGFGLYKCMRQLLTLINEQERNERIILMNKELSKLYTDPLKELLAYAKADVLKRILYILKELLEKGESKWLFILKTQLASLKEINEITKIVSV